MLWPLYIETGHWSDDFLTDRMTGSGRLQVPANGRSGEGQLGVRTGDHTKVTEPAL